jgi:hypothetical protein
MAVLGAVAIRHRRLEGAMPAALLRNPEGQRVVETLLDRMRGGLVA